MGLKKRYTTFFIFLFVFITGFLQASTDKYRCMWQEDPSSTMVIGWNQISGSQPVLYFDVFDGGDDPQLYAYSQKPDRVSVFKGMNNHFVLLRGLLPATVYYFIIKDSDSVSRRMSFRTAPNHSGERISIIAGGDSRNFRNARKRANMLVAKLQPHCVMFGGDMTGGDTDGEWLEWMDDWQATISPEGRLTPIIATRGNHEYSNKTIIELFEVPHPDVYYSLELGGDLLQIYTLNSLIATGGEQRNWLANELQQSHHVWKMAQYHYGMRPHTSRKTERNTQMVNWASLFYDFQVNLVVESDAHVVKTTWPIRPSRASGSDEGFIRDDERGTVYVGEGCWGAPLRSNNDDKSWTRNSGSFNQFKWIFVDREKIEVRTVKTDNAEEVASVSPYDIFSPPAGIDIWSPSNGPVLMIYPSQQKDFPVAVAYPVSQDAQNWTASKNTMIGTLPTKVNRPAPVVSAIQISDFSIETEEGKAPSLKWHTKEEYNPQLVYELQRSKDGQHYQTIAEVMAQGAGGGQYRITDTGGALEDGQALHYRLRFVANGKEQLYEAASKVYTAKNPWRAFPELIPDENSGQVKVKYCMEKEGSASITLVNSNDKEISINEYSRQKAGNYLKTIDMAIFPKGRYLLIIKVDEDQVSRYQVIWK